MRHETGWTLPETLVVLALGGVIVTSGAVLAASTLTRETMRGTLHDAGSLVQMARIESIRRNHPCRFVVDPGARTMTVVDTQGTPSTADDTVLRSSSIPAVVAIARPDVGPPITFAVSGSSYLIEFDPGGYVVSGAGDMVLFGGDRYSRVFVYAAGGIRYEKWDGSSWIIGS